jgi:hypothetical protein
MIGSPEDLLSPDIEKGFSIEVLVSDSAVHRMRGDGRPPSYNELYAHRESHSVSDSDFRWQGKTKRLVKEQRGKQVIPAVMFFVVNCAIPRNLSGC